MSVDSIPNITFSDFPEDVQLCILSFLTPSDISAFACTSKRYASLCHVASHIWYALCDRKWGPHTHITKWCDGHVTSFKLLFSTLSELDRLIGFWRRSGSATANVNGSASGIIGDAPLVFFEWGVSCVTGSRVSPATDGSYSIIKSPFIWLSLSADGHPLNYVKTNPTTEPTSTESSPGSSSSSNPELVRVNVNFMGNRHLVLEESGIWNGNGNGNGGSPISIINGNGNGYGRNGSFGHLSENNGVDLENLVGVGVGVGVEVGSPPDRVTSEMYQYFANRTSPGAGGERAWRRQRRREKERQGRRKWDPEHLVKIVHWSPTPCRPLQGLWKGICDDMTLDFFLVAYDDIGGVSCRRIGDSLKPFSGFAPVFWTSNATFINSPLSHEEDYLYNTRTHLRPLSESEEDIYEHSPSRLMYINSSYELVLPNLAGTVVNPRHVEGRIWQYVDGTFGFGFLRNNVIVDLKHIAQNGNLLDAAQQYNA
ncbi:F-box protein At3g12350-like [Silene latifolia]|uniref:F-box protein At3g12350-like n=1 Tax=Silene latifolia TaxID=37657 RepID=UPI003D76C189